jgi:hypothetical protein
VTKQPKPEPEQSPEEIARVMVNGGAFTDKDAIRVADMYLWHVDDGATEDVA